MLFGQVGGLFGFDFMSFNICDIDGVDLWFVVNGFDGVVLVGFFLVSVFFGLDCFD